MNRLRELFATCLYVGYVPGAPGTYGSVLSAAVFVILGKPLATTGWVIFLVVFILSMFALSRAVEVFGHPDPRPVVLDEFAGMWLAFLVGGTADWILLAVGFVFFRVFDAAKPFPIRRLERMPGWRGVLADDLAAGLAAGIIVRLAAVYVFGH